LYLIGIRILVMKDNQNNKPGLILVDDEPKILNSLVRELRDWAKEKEVELFTFSSPLEALKFLKEGSREIALIVSDLKMPELSGYELLREAKGIKPDMGTIVLSGYFEMDEIVKAIRVGISRFILKPWESDLLLKELNDSFNLYVLQKKERENRTRLQEEYKWAGIMQRALLRSEKIEHEQVQFELTYVPLPTFGCSGDYYDIINLGEDRFLMILGDVSGHGITGAFVTGILKAIIYSEYIREHRLHFIPSQFLNWLNVRLLKQLQELPSIFITMALCMIDLKAQTVTVSTAGHNPVVYFQEEQEELSSDNPALCFDESIQYRDVIRPLFPGSRIVLYTDGLSEVEPPSVIVSQQDLLRILTTTKAGEGEYNNQILEKIKKHTKKQQFTDDVTLMSAWIVENG